MIKQALGQRVATLRRAKGLSQDVLGEKSHYSTEFISLVERGVNAPSVEGLYRIASALGVQVRDLFDFGGGAR